MTKLSHSSVSSYQDCPEKYRLHYIKRLRPKKLKSSLFFGGALDQALNVLLLEKNLDKAKETFIKFWTYTKHLGETIDVPESEIVVYTKNDKDDELLKHYNMENEKNLPWTSMVLKAFLMLEVYNKEILPKIKRVISVQKPIKITNADGDQIDGLLDLEVEWEDGKTYLLDNKSSTVKYSPTSPKESQQLVLYYYVEKENIKLDGVGFIVLDKNINKNRVKTCKSCGTINESTHKTCPELAGKKKCGGDFNVTITPSCDYSVILNSVDEADEKRVVEAFDLANQGIINEEFAPNKNACWGKFGRCDFYDICHQNDESEFVVLPPRKKDDSKDKG